MKRSKTRLGLLLAFAFAPLLSLSACGGSNPEVPAIPIAPSTASKSQSPIPVEGKNVYFAGPMFNAAEKEFNLRFTHVLEEYGYTVFLPQRDGIEAATLEGKTEEELIEMIFALDDGQVRANDIVFMNLDGRAPDEGACVELGIAYALGKRCYGFKTDTRSVESNMDLNPMIAGCMRKIFKNYDADELEAEIRLYLSENEL